jgi:hypothetical protein
MSAQIPRFAAPLVLLALATLFSACSSSDAAPTPGNGGSEGAPITLDWTRVAEVTLDNGWVIDGCGGDAPFRCIREGGETIGAIELIDFPADPDLLEAVENGTIEAWFEARIDGNHEFFAEDRAAGCGADYEYRAAETRHLTIAGAPAASYGFSGSQGGREIERHRDYLVVHEGSLWILKTPASDPQGCLASEFPELTPEQLAAFEPLLDRLARGMVLPSGG